MKFLVVLSSILAVSIAYEIYGFDNVRPIHEIKSWRDSHPALAALLQDAPIQGRIIAGAEAAPHQFPYQVALLPQFEDGTGLCGGSIIATDYILTAANCVAPDIYVTVVLAAHDRTQDETNQFRVQSSDITIHPDYDVDSFNHDIALIRLTVPLTFSQFVQPVLLPRLSQLAYQFAGDFGTVAGWGRISDDNDQPATLLHWVSAPILDNEVCNRWYQDTILQTKICTEQATCTGDFGGALVITDEYDDVIQVGVASFGSTIGCARAWPVVYTRITDSFFWIHEVVGDSLIQRP